MLASSVTYKTMKAGLVDDGPDFPICPSVVVLEEAPHLHRLVHLDTPCQWLEVFTTF
jgi:hypothetical protein